VNEYQPPKRVVIEENLGGAAGIGIGILLLALIFYLNREHAIDLSKEKPPGQKSEQIQPVINTQIVDAATLKNPIDQIEARQQAQAKAQAEWLKRTSRTKEKKQRDSVNG